ncbi:MAG: citramalate synthase [Candidatus Omnitrophica bacterium]|nr:citramalate synthase [Candidatus Omnitrophota bacterium]
MQVKLYDTTLRDGTQGEGVSLSVQDKLRIVERLDHLGIHYIEGGFPGSNPKDIEFFKQVKRLKLKTAKVAAFGSTRRADSPASKDVSLNALLRAETEVVTIFGKSWDLHVKDVLRISPEENLKVIADSVSYLKKHGLEVVYDAEHFFDGYQRNASYALSSLKAAEEAGASVLVLCDTNGGMITSWVAEVVREVKEKTHAPLGIHVHNDSDMAVANSITAVENGVLHVQGTINGYGERCGNANLCSIIANLKLKLGIDCVTDKALQELAENSRAIAEICNMKHRDNQPYVGKSAFAHKGGVHVNAVMKNPVTYEHVEPERVGNRRRILVSELSGKSTMTVKAEELGLHLDKDPKLAKKILDEVRELELQGYHFEVAEGSFELLMHRSLKSFKEFFSLEGFRVTIEKKEGDGLVSEATIKVKVGDREEYTVAEGDGPVNALDNALRKALKGFYPSITSMHLTDFKVRVLDEKAGTAAKVRVLIESQDETDSWVTIGVSENIIEASWKALVDSIEYKLLKDKKKK